MDTATQALKFENKAIIPSDPRTKLFLTITVSTIMITGGTGGFMNVVRPCLMACPLIFLLLSKQRFVKLTAALEQEQESNQKRLHDLTMMQSRADAQESEVRTFIREIRRYSAIEELDEAVLNRLISRILIGEVKKVDGQKVQEVRIVYNFVGEIPEIAA